MVTIGGFPFAEKKEIGNIETHKTSMSGDCEVSGAILDADTNEPIPDVKVGAFKGSNTMEELIGTPRTKGPTTKKGDWHLGHLPTDPYVFKAQKHGYHDGAKSDAVCLPKMKTSTNMGMFKKNSMYPGEFKFILSWGDKPLDLDLHVQFKIQNNHLCDVSFTNSFCGDVEYLTENSLGGHNGVETVLMHQMGDFVYLVYAEQYSHAGEEPFPLSKSQANMEIFYSIPDEDIVQVADVGLPKPKKDDNDLTSKFWNMLCIDGRDGKLDIRQLNTVTPTEAGFEACMELFAKG